MKRKKITATIDGISYKIDSYEHTTEFGNRNKDTVAEFLKDSYEGNIDENYNLSNGYSYIFVTMTYTNNTDEQVEILRNAGAFYIINDDLERLQVGDPRWDLYRQLLDRRQRKREISLCTWCRRKCYIRGWIYYSG